MTSTKPSKEEYAKAVCLFLGEMLRTRKIGLTRSAEIAQRVVENINLIDSEQHFLTIIKELSKDFEELHRLEKIVIKDIQINQRHAMEEKVREYVVGIMASDTKQALAILVEATADGAELESLLIKFPDFGKYAKVKHEFTK